jgi:hypothetical protein
MRLFGRKDLLPVIVASMGRSGSTVCYNAIAQGMARERFGFLPALKKNATRSSAWDVANYPFKPGIVYKTHALADELPPTFAGKVVFTFGQASDAALSVVACRQKYGDEWVAEHFEHLRANGDFQELGERDVLRFEEQIDGWLNLQGHDIMAIRYDALWDHSDELAAFLGFPVRLPPKRARQSLDLVDESIVAGFRKTYASLDAKIAALPNRIVRRVS